MKPADCNGAKLYTLPLTVADFPNYEFPGFSRSADFGPMETRARASAPWEGAGPLWLRTTGGKSPGPPAVAAGPEKASFLRPGPRPEGASEQLAPESGGICLRAIRVEEASFLSGLQSKGRRV